MKNLIKNFLKMLAINKINIFFIIGILCMGIFLRVYHLDEIYTEYDDVGVVSLHKSISSKEKEIKLYEDNILGINMTIKAEGLKETLLDSILYPVYMGYTWTYPATQYLLYPFLIDEKDEYFSKITKSRSISSFFSIVSLFLLTYILFLLNNKKIDKNILIPVSVLAFSYNSVLYAHHASPYSLTVTVFLLSLLCFISYHKNKISITNFFIIHAFLVISNYLILILMPIYLILMVVNIKEFNFIFLFKKFYKGFFLFVIIFLPIFIVFFKPSKGLHGSLPPEGFSFESILYFPKQLIFSISSSIQGFFVFDYITVLIVTLSVLFCVYIYCKNYYKSQELDGFILLFIFLLCIEWMILHLMGKLIMDQTRHMLMWSPIISILLFFVIKNIKLNTLAIILFTSSLSLYGLYNNINLIDSKKSNLEIKFMNDHEFNVVFTYGFTLSPLIALPKKNVYNIDVNSFNKNTFSKNIPKEALLVSQSESIENYLKNSNLNQFPKELLSKYDVQLIKRIDSDIYFTYNNYSISSTKNGFYLYKLTLKE